MSKIPTRKLTQQFPRTNGLPTQSSKFWAKEKDRYLRQLLLADLEAHTGREVIVYYSQLFEGIGHSDSDDLSEIIEGLSTESADIILQTPGGLVDAVEKVVTVLKARLDDYRVIVPSWAKSGGTVIAISSDEILLGVNSELGPIDPQMTIPGIGSVPCEFVANDQAQPQVIRDLADSAVKRMGSLAKKYLEAGMLKGQQTDAIDEAISKISSSQTYNSHGAVIDYSEAKDLGLSVQWMKPEDELWKRVWLLYSCYDYDAKLKNYAKIIEGAVNSIARQAPR